MDETIKRQLETLNQQVKDLTAIYRRNSSEFGVSDNEFWIWYALLVMEEEYSQQDICDMWSLPKQTVNSVVANLRQKDYIYLEVVPGTRNRKIIRLSESGKEFGEKIISRIYDAEQRTFARMSKEERQTCVDLIGKYVSLLREEINEI